MFGMSCGVFAFPLETATKMLLTPPAPCVTSASTAHHHSRHMSVHTGAKRKFSVCDSSLPPAYQCNREAADGASPSHPTFAATSA
jgi:hypothetical protein